MTPILEETETSLYQNALDRNQWHMGTEDPIWIARMKKLGIEPIKVGSGGWHEYALSADQVVIRKGKRFMSDDQRKMFTERLQEARLSRAAHDGMGNETELPPSQVS